MKNYLALFLLISLNLSGCGNFATSSPEELVSRAEVFEEKGDLRSAMIELKNALGIEPDNIRARWLLGKVYLAVGAFEGAEKELTRAQSLGVEEVSVLPLLAQSWLKQVF